LFLCVEGEDIMLEFVSADLQAQKYATEVEGRRGRATTDRHQTYHPGTAKDCMHCTKTCQ